VHPLFIAGPCPHLDRHAHIVGTLPATLDVVQFRGVAIRLTVKDRLIDVTSHGCLITRRRGLRSWKVAAAVMLPISLIVLVAPSTAYSLANTYCGTPSANHCYSVSYSTSSTYTGVAGSENAAFMTPGVTSGTEQLVHNQRDVASS